MLIFIVELNSKKNPFSKLVLDLVIGFGYQIFIINIDVLSFGELGVNVIFIPKMINAMFMRMCKQRKT